MKPDLQVIIPTADRPESLKKMLESITKQSVQPTKVIVVDQSDHSQTESVTRGFSIPLAYKRLSVKSATRARNHGLDEAKDAQYIALLDDDLILEPDYLALLLQALQTADESYREPVCAAMGSIHNMPSIPLPYHEKKLMLPGPGEGEVLRSGFATTPHWKRDRMLCRFVSAGLAVYKASAIQTVRFDERLLGNSIAEDVDVSARIIPYGKILFVPEARCVHEMSPVNRLDSFRIYKQYIQNTYYIGSKNKELVQFSKLCFWRACYGLSRRLLYERNFEGIWGIFCASIRILFGHLDSVH